MNTFRVLVNLLQFCITNLMIISNALSARFCFRVRLEREASLLIASAKLSVREITMSLSGGGGSVYLSLFLRLPCLSPALHFFSSIRCVSFRLLWCFNVGFVRLIVDSEFTTDEYCSHTCTNNDD